VALAAGVRQRFPEGAPVSAAGPRALRLAAALLAFTAAALSFGGGTPPVVRPAAPAVRQRLDDE